MSDGMTQKWLIDMLDTMLIYTCATFDVNDEENKEKVRRAYTQIKKWIRQKPTVTENEVKELVQACSQCGGVSDICVGCLSHARTWLEETLNVEVVE